MSRENVEVVRRVMEARVRGDAEAALANARRARLFLGPALLAPAVVYTVRAGKIARFEPYADPALEAVGLRE